MAFVNCSGSKSLENIFEDISLIKKRKSLNCSSCELYTTRENLLMIVLWMNWNKIICFLKTLICKSGFQFLFRKLLNGLKTLIHDSLIQCKMF